MMMAAASVVTAAAAAVTEQENKSSSAGLFWTSAKDEQDLLLNPESTAAPQDELDGGFSSLDSMLQWAIGHSDPAKLKETAQDAKRLSPNQLKDRQLELQQLMEKLNTPSDAKLMRIAIDDLNNSSISLEDRYRALHELLILVEHIDNANDLHKLAGIVAVTQELNHPDAEVRRLSAWILGTASQNNPIVQKQVLEHGALAKLMKMVKSSSVDEAIKALYAVSAIIRNNLAGQELFYSEAGVLVLQDLLSNSSTDIRLCKKAVFLVGDLTECHLENNENPEPPLFSDQDFLKSVVDLTASTDLDLQEKALVAIKNLLQLRTAKALVFKDECGLDGALERMKQQLKDLMQDEDQKDYASDLESLRLEVELIFHGKLAKATMVPT
jgi:nucleotide exchange factor SIL1